jgi:hypothetical protein
MENIPTTPPNQPITISTPGKPDRKKKSRNNRTLHSIELFTDDGFYAETVSDVSFDTPIKKKPLRESNVSVKK